LKRIKVHVPHVSEKSERDSKVKWARDFREVLDSGLLNE
jgi:hypothetical protein